MTLNKKYIASILLIAAFGFNAFGQQVSPFLLDQPERMEIKVGKPILLYKSISVELLEMTIDRSQQLRLRFVVKNVAVPGSISFAATTRIVRDAEGFQYEGQTVSDWNSGGKRLLKGTQLESTATLVLRDSARNQRSIEPVLIASAFRLNVYREDGLLNPYPRRTVWQSSTPIIFEIDKDKLREVVAKNKPKAAPAPERPAFPKLSLDIDKFDKLKYGMSYQDVAKILGGPGERSRQSGGVTVRVDGKTNERVENPSYEWRALEFGTIICGFSRGALQIKRLQKELRQDFKLPNLTNEKYSKLEKGMTYSTVRKILGAHGQLQTVSSTRYRILERFVWFGEKSTVHMSFRDGKASSIRWSERR